MSAIDNLAFASVKELAGMIKRKEISPVEVTDYFLDRIDRRNPSLNALVYVDREGARAAAKNAEDELMKGASSKPLLGIPTAAKDIGPSCPGWPDTMGGIRALKDFRLPGYSLYMERMIAAGAIPIGKTNSPVFAFRGLCDNYLFGPTRNPFDPARNSGGSSGGAAAAVADGLLPFAEGSDAGGSIRIPAAWCNLFGFKASYGSFPALWRPGGFGSSMIFVATGPMARSVEDTAITLNAYAGYDSRDPFCRKQTVDYTSALLLPMKGLRIGYTEDFGGFPVDPEIRDMTRKAALRFGELGATVVPVQFDCPYSPLELGELWCRMITLSTITNLESFKESGMDLLKTAREDLPPTLLHWIDIGYRMGSLEILRDQNMRTTLFDRLEDVMETCDLLLSPTLACHPILNAENGDTMMPGVLGGTEIEPSIGWCLTFLANFTGHAAASVPIGLSKDGFPVGMQIIGQRYGDPEVLAAGAAFERISPWMDLYARTQARPL